VGARSRASTYRRAHPLRFWIGVGGAVAATVMTLYLGTMTVLWGLHIEELRADRSELVQRDSEQRATVEAQEAAVFELRTTLTGNLRAVTDGAHEKANYEDLRYVYHEYSVLLRDCADERAKVLHYVRTLFTEHWIIWQVHRYDDDVTDYCNQVKESWAAALAEEDS